jgi:hypothetical protein
MLFSITCYKDYEMARQDPQVNVRIPEKTLERFKEETQKERRTITAQMNMIIEEWLEARAKQNEAKA